MSVQVSYPGVYIDEVTSAGAISGVGTSTAAFLGPADDGPLNVPTKITSWDKFKKTFGEDPADGFYLWYAVRGFFENGGKVCYVTRVSNGKYDNKTFSDRNPASSGGSKPVLTLRAREIGDNSADPITVVVTNSSAVNTVFFRPEVDVKSANGNVIEVAKSAGPVDDSATLAAQFRLQDTVFIKEGSSKSDTRKIVLIEGNLIRLDSPLSAAYGNTATVRLANTTTQTDTIRVMEGSSLAVGSVVKIVQAASGSQTRKEEYQIVKNVQVERLSGTFSTYRVTLKRTLNNSYVLTRDVTVNSQEFALTVTKGSYSHTYGELSVDPGHPTFYATVINADVDGIVTAQPVDPPNNTPIPDNLPRITPGTPAPTPEHLEGGTREDNRILTSQDYKVALARLEAIDDINMIAIPDRADADVQLAVIGHCEMMKDRFAILDSRRGVEPFGAGSVVTQRFGLDSARGYAALYYPWLRVAPHSGGQLLLVPPCGHVAGVYARTDGSRGVHKAPAGVETAVNGALGVDRMLSDDEQGQLNDVGVNVIRVFRDGGRPIVWGARTTAPKEVTDWRYVSTRRLFLFIEESIQESIRWAVFEPNNIALWEKLKRVIRAFLRQQWRDGALFGETEEQAFFVRIDEDINPESERQLGRLNIEIGVKPAFPAEFIIVRIGVWQGGSQILEG